MNGTGFEGKETIYVTAEIPKEVYETLKEAYDISVRLGVLRASLEEFIGMHVVGGQMAGQMMAQKMND